MQYGTSEFSRALDNYITSGRPSNETQTLKCPKCGHTVEVDMYCEYGICEPLNEDDIYCPQCRQHNNEDIEME